MEELVKLAVKPLAFGGVSSAVVGLAYLGIQLKDGISRRGGGEALKAVAMIAAGFLVVAFAARYGFSGF